MYSLCVSMHVCTRHGAQVEVRGLGEVGVGCCSVVWARLAGCERPRSSVSGSHLSGGVPESQWHTASFR